MKRILAALLLAVALTGCATRWVVESDVQTFSKIEAPPAEATFRFDRLPSQQYDEAAQQLLEAMATPALMAAGLRRDDARPHFAAMINARVSSELSPWVDPWFYGGPWWGPGPRWGGAWGPGWGPGWGRGWYGGGWYGPALPPPNPWFQREVSIVLRELPSNRVVFESNARNDGPYTASQSILPVMFQAAMQGFPNPPQGTRRVNIEITTGGN